MCPKDATGMTTSLNPDGHTFPSGTCSISIGTYSVNPDTLLPHSVNSNQTAVWFEFTLYVPILRIDG